MRKITFLISVIGVLSGCIYSIEFAPPYERTSSTIDQPLELSVSLGDISRCFMTKCEPQSHKELLRIDSVFIDCAQKENLFKDVLPVGSETDLFLEIIYYPDLSSDISRKQRFYRDLLNWSVLGYVTPLPYPFYLDVEYAIYVNAAIEETIVPVKRYAVQFKNTIRTASILGARFKRNVIQDQTIKYIAPIIFDNIKRDYPFYKDIKKICKAKDREKLQSLAIESL